jgi:hypothetical protein
MFMFCIDLWGFSIDPIYLVYNSSEQETLCYVFFKFRGPSGTLTEIGLFWHYYFSRRKSMRRRSAREGHCEAQTSTGGVGPRPGHATLARFCLEPPMPSIMISDWWALPKNPYIKTPWGLLARRRRRNTKPQNRGWTCEDWGRFRSHPRSLLQDLQHHQHRHHDEEGVVHL